MLLHYKDWYFYLSPDLSNQDESQSNVKVYWSSHIIHLICTSGWFGGNINQKIGNAHFLQKWSSDLD
mgnify:CR=1 FL=1